MIAIGPVAARLREGGDPLLMIAIDEHLALCIDEAGVMEWIEMVEMVVVGWTYQPEAGIWVSEGEELLQEAEPTESVD